MRPRLTFRVVLAVLPGAALALLAERVPHVKRHVRHLSAAATNPLLFFLLVVIGHEILEIVVVAATKAEASPSIHSKQARLGD